MTKTEPLLVKVEALIGLESSIKTRQEMLQKKLEEILGSENVYFQPPESIKMKYPCIIYQLQSYDLKYADNIVYKKKQRWRLTVVDKDPQSDITDMIISNLPYCYFDRFFTKDGLNHWSLSLYF